MQTQAEPPGDLLLEGSLSGGKAWLGELPDRVVAGGVGGVAGLGLHQPLGPDIDVRDDGPAGARSLVAGGGSMAIADGVLFVARDDGVLEQALPYLAHRMDGCTPPPGLRVHDDKLATRLLVPLFDTPTRHGSIRRPMRRLSEIGRLSVNPNQTGHQCNNGISESTPMRAAARSR